jgi:hypothetical protein
MTVRRLAPLAALVAAAGIVVAQPPAKTDPAPKKDAPPAKKEPAKPAPGSLEDTLEKALRNSADIKAAEAKVREAEAELNRVRQQVLTKATALHADLNVAKRMLAVAEQTLAIQERMAANGQAGVTDRLTALAMVEKHRGEVEKLETELKSLRGEFAFKGVPASLTFSPTGDALWIIDLDGRLGVSDVTSGAIDQRVRPWTADAFRPIPIGGAKTPAVQTPMMDRVKRMLDKEVELNSRESAAPDALKAVLDQAGGDIPLRDTLPANQHVGTVTLKGKLPVGAWIQAVEDSDPELRVVVRDYGLLVTTRDRVPEGALRVQDLWKGNYAEVKPKKVDEKKP